MCESYDINSTYVELLSRFYRSDLVTNGGMHRSGYALVDEGAYHFDDRPIVGEFDFFSVRQDIDCNITDNKAEWVAKLPGEGGKWYCTMGRVTLRLGRGAMQSATCCNSCPEPRLRSWHVLASTSVSNLWAQPRDFAPDACRLRHEHISRAPCPWRRAIWCVEPERAQE